MTVFGEKYKTKYIMCVRLNGTTIRNMKEDTLRPCHRWQSLQWEWLQGYVLHCTSPACLVSFGRHREVMDELARSV